MLCIAIWFLLVGGLFTCYDVVFGWCGLYF